LLKSNSNVGTETVREYDKSGWLRQYREKAPTYDATDDYLCDILLRQIQNQVHKNDAWRLTTQLSNFTAAGNPQTEESHYNRYGAYTHYDYGYQYLNREEQSRVSGYSYNNQGGTKYLKPKYVYFNGNWLPNSKGPHFITEVLKSGVPTPEKIIFESTHDGLILRKTHIEQLLFYQKAILDIFFKIGIADLGTCTDNEYTFTDPQGCIFGTYMNQTQKKRNDSTNLHSFLYGNETSFNGGCGSLVSSTAVSGCFATTGGGEKFKVPSAVNTMIDNPAPAYDLETHVVKHHGLFHSSTRMYTTHKDTIPAPMSTYPSVAPKRFTVPQDNMNLAAVSKAATGSPQHAAALAMANGWTTSKTCHRGEVVKIPQLQMNTNNVVDYPNYAKLMAALIGPLTPHVEWAQPKPHHHGFFSKLFHIVIRIVIDVVAVTVAAYFAPAASVLGMLANSLIAGLTDAALQEAAVGVGALEHFSLSEALQTGLQSGVSKYLGDNSPEKKFGKAFFKGSIKEKVTDLAEVSAYHGAMSMTQQMAEMAVGLRHKLDMNAVAESMVDSAIEAGLSVELPSQKVFIPNASTETLKTLPNKWWARQSLVIKST
jgi:hypothetical protein